MKWFGGDYSEYYFEMFSVSHYTILSILVVVTLAIFLFRERLKNKNWKVFEIGFAISLIIIESSYHYWMIVNGFWSIRHSIPLDLCSISLILTILLLLTRYRLFYEILLFTALLGATQALFTPVLEFDFPHFRFIHFFYTHLMTIWTVFYFTWAKDYRPTIWSVVKLLVFLNVLLPIVLYVNKRVDGNYMFLSHKPSTVSLLDYLGPYPYYILSMEGLLISLSIIIWLIFRDRSVKNK